MDDVTKLVLKLETIASRLMGRKVVEGVLVNETCQQAADTITRLSARVEELEAKLDSLEEDYVFDLDRFGDA